jgi:hypothetical protein
MGPAGPDERAAARRAPRSPSRPAGGTGQGIVRSSIPAWSKMAIWLSSMRSVIRCLASWQPTLS